MKIVIVSSEVVPFAKTGGLADVCGALPEALKNIGSDTCVFMPKYREVNNYFKKNNILPKSPCPGLFTFEIKGVNFYFIEHNDYFDRDGLYGTAMGDYPDNAQRFGFFCKRTLEYLKQIGFKPDIIHCHDWQAALAITYLKNNSKHDSFFKKTKTVLTIHNLAYQGLFDKSEMPKIELNDNLFNIEGLEFYWKVNLLKGGIVFSDLITTVSPTYAKEIQTKEFGCGLEGLLFSRNQKLKGVINGLDYFLWNPEKDSLIYKKFSIKKINDKYENKVGLQKEVGLKVSKDIPLFGIVTRLAEQKGVDIISEAMEIMCNKDLQLVILGTGDIKYHQILEGIAKKHKNFVLLLKFDNRLAHDIYAASDFFLMPSRYEPCGLGQMISLKYGSLPLVSKTGGLADTIIDIDDNSVKGNGMLLKDYSKKSLLEVVDRSLDLYTHTKSLHKVINVAMNNDFSWEESAREYQKLFKALLK